MHPLALSAQTKKLFAVQLLLSLLLFSHALAVWDWADRHFFTWVNAPLANSHSLRLFFAYANQRLADWIMDLCILGFYSWAIWKAGKGHRHRRAAELLFSILWTALTILLINRLFCRDLLSLRRASPCHVIESAVLLSDTITAFPIKEFTMKSFPGDHATTAMLFAMSYAYFVRGKAALLALLFGAFLCLPRLVVGAHWLSDIVVGSGSIALFSLSIAFFTPLSSSLIMRIEKMLRLFSVRFIK